ncbi:GNAT family N-acetyltransferase [Paenibacillus campi]|uniref:GNAT family N-acetyltransferase n=1 Tax=Paenibacillus campi TaxID=3106031 RepID=UPI002AFF6100|nr:GNAT family N-acetyltransferase [Paenibacillus sp. SGZ-1014]
MTTYNDQIQIVEYEPRYAASIAEMWNASQESWGGDNALQTEQMILQEHHNSPHLNIFLAVNGEQVIGYCSFSHYKEDAGALYIALLNVRPDYHGHKIGKRLVLRAVEETIKLGWPRVDLYTWSGNSKAVPAYKKAGFFWERREDVTHLINLIPSVLQTPAVQPYFAQLDWYNDSIREIVTEPDGHGENGFDYFTYEWRKDNVYLRMEYERTGRGLRLIETDDYMIQATIPKRHRLPFGTSYPIEYELINKTGKPLQVDIQARSNEQVAWSLHQSIDVQERETVHATFELNPIEEEQDPYQTHPVVEAELLINGQAAVFKLGIEPRFPVRLKLHQPEQTPFVGKELEIELSLENEYDTEQTYRICWQEHRLLSFRERTLTMQVPAHGRQALTVKATVLDYGIWYESLTIERAVMNNETVAQLTDSELPSTDASPSTHYVKVLEQPISLVLSGAQSVFGGQTADGWVASNGAYHVHLNKLTNAIHMYKGTEYGGMMFYPKFGLPYDNAFKQDRAIRVSFHQQEALIRMEAEYELQSLQLRLKNIIQLHQNGIITQHYEVHNIAGQERTEPLFLKGKFELSLHNSILPYQNGYVDTAYGPDASSSDYWLIENMTENWVFHRKKHNSWGITWPQERILLRDHWHYALEHPLGTLQAGETVSTPPLRIAGGTWSDWQDFRAFALETSQTKPLQTEPPLEIVLNDGNPFITTEQAKLTVIERKNTVLNGTIIAVSPKRVERQQFDITAEQQLQTWNGSLSLSPATPGKLDMLQLLLDMDSYELKQQRLLIPVSDEPMITSVRQTEQGDVHCVQNGVLEFKVSNRFAPVVFSLQHDGVEWIDSSFPEPGPKSWWNPWTGGLTVQLKGMSSASILKQPRSVSFTDITDSLGNHWYGVAIEMEITDHAIYKGLLLRQYYVTLPGAPVMASFVHVRQQTGSSFAPLVIRQWNYCKASEGMTDSRVSLRNLAGESLVCKAGKAGYETEVPDGIISLSAQERTYRLHIVADTMNQTSGVLVDASVILSEMSSNLYTRHGEEEFTAPQFWVFSETELPVDTFAELKRIRFGKRNAGGETSDEK